MKLGGNFANKVVIDQNKVVIPQNKVEIFQLGGSSQKEGGNSDRTKLGGNLRMPPNWYSRLAN